jgi:hypothetical protein
LIEIRDGFWISDGKFTLSPIARIHINANVSASAALPCFVITEICRIVSWK